MTENDIKESLSRAFISMIVNQCGYKMVDVTQDYGTDALISEVIYRMQPNGKKRYFDSGKQIQCQFKATNEKKVNRNNGVLTYALENKTYNDLIFRKNTQRPLILFLYILPEDRKEWIKCNADYLIAKRHVYWYDIPKGLALLKNENSRKTIEIPEKNLVNLDTFPGIFKHFTEL